jgi:serine O-acetyltransferase
MFETVREDWRRHGSLIHNRALLTLWVYRLGRWGMAHPSAPVRWLVAKLYGVLYFFTEAFTGVHLRKEVTIGEGFHLIHPGSTFIHPKVVIGDRVGVMQNVVIGTNMDERVPVIGNDVFIGANACVLGAVTVGDGARIAANSLVINDVPANSFAVGVPAKAFPRLGTAKKD